MMQNWLIKIKQYNRFELEVTPKVCNKYANFDRMLQFCGFYCMFVVIGIGLKYWLSGIYNNRISVYL